MSRGLGKIQRELLAVLRKHQRTAEPQAAATGLSTRELASRVYYGFPGWGGLTKPEQQVAVRRALAGLARSGLVLRMGAMHYGSRDCHWHVGLWAYDR
jgi:hypothetical protein